MGYRSPICRSGLLEWSKNGQILTPGFASFAPCGPSSSETFKVTLIIFCRGFVEGTRVYPHKGSWMGLGLLEGHLIKKKKKRLFFEKKKNTKKKFFNLFTFSVTLRGP